MKKTTTYKLIAMLLAVVMFASTLTGCGYDALGEELGVTKDDTHQHENANGDTANTVKPEDGDFQAQIDSINQQLAETTVAVETVKAENEALKLENEELKASAEESAEALETANGEKARLQTENDALTREVKASDSEKDALLARIAELEAQLANSKPAVEVIDGTVFCDGDYFLKRATVIFADGTAALKAIKDGTPVVVDDVHGIGSKSEYRDPTFNLPWKYENGGYNIAITFDASNVYYADFSNYHWASSSLWQRGAAKTGYPLKETKKHSSLGWFDEIINSVAVCVPNPDAEYGYDFYVAVGYNDPNPYVCTHAKGCHCGNCDKCPALEPEVEVETKYVCKVCGKENCNGHAEVETKYVCKVCGKENCNGHAEVETKYVCKVCGKENCNGHVEVETKYVDRCGRCGYLMENCICSNPGHNDRPTDETTTPPEEDSTQNPEGDGTVVETPDHNDHPTDGTTTPPEEDSTKNPESDGTEVELPDHNDRPGEVEHSERPGEGGETTPPSEDSTQNPEGDGTVVETPVHNDRHEGEKSEKGEDSTGKTEGDGTVVETPSHSPRP